MNTTALVLLTDFCRNEGIVYDWIRHRVGYFNWTRGDDGRLYVDPNETRSYLANFVTLPPAARVARTAAA